MFVDYRKAFDSVRHAKIWEGLNKQGVPKEVINVLKSVYKNAEPT